MLNRHYLLFLIILLGFCLRFYQLGSNPPSLNIDEVSIGYNAYSILKTGKDEFGKPSPFAFRSYDDYKPPLYIYLTVPSVAVFGLNNFAVRFPAALMGTIAILTTYLLASELFRRRERVALLSALLISILPWHLQFTRTAFEVGGMAFFTTFGLWLLIRGNRTRNFHLFFFAGLMLGAEGLLYQAARLFIPLLVIVVGAIYCLPGIWAILRFRTFTLVRRQLIWAGFAIGFFVIFIPILILTFTPEGQARFKGTTIFQNFDPHQYGISWEQRDWLNRDRFSAFGFHQESLFYDREILIGYFTHLRPDFLYLGLSGPKVNLIPGVGLEPIWTLPFLICGIYYLIAKRDKKPLLLLLGWIAMSPVPAALTWDIPTSIRSAVMIPALEIVAAFGLVSLLTRLRVLRASLPVVVMSIAVAAAIYSVAFMLHMHFIHGPGYLDKQWYGSYGEVVRKTMELASNYEQVIVSTDIDQPHGFFLYYSAYDPIKYQREGGTVSGSFSEEGNRMGNISFHRFDFSQAPSGVLLVGRQNNFPVGQKRLATFKYANGEDNIVIAEKP